MMLITIKDACKLMNVTKSKFIYHMDQGTIPAHCEEIRSENGVMHLWDEAAVIKAIEPVKNYKRGQQVTRAQKKYNQKRVSKLRIVDRFAAVFNQYLFNHCKVTPTAPQIR